MSAPLSPPVLLAPLPLLPGPGWANTYPACVAETIASARGAKGTPPRPIATPITDPDKVNAMANAVARVLAGEISARAAALADPRITMNTLQHKVRQAKKRAGIPIRKNKSRHSDPALSFAPAPPPQSNGSRPTIKNLRSKDMQRKLISSGSPFEAEIGYSRAVVQGDWILVSGTTGSDYAAMTIAEDIETQTEQCMKNIAHALAQAGGSLQDIVRVNYVLPDGKEFSNCWPVLRKYLGDVRPAAMMLSAGLLDPRMKIEIEVTALKSR